MNRNLLINNLIYAHSVLFTYFESLSVCYISFRFFDKSKCLFSCF